MIKQVIKFLSVSVCFVFVLRARVESSSLQLMNSTHISVGRKIADKNIDVNITFVDSELTNNTLEINFVLENCSDQFDELTFIGQPEMVFGDKCYFLDKNDVTCEKIRESIYYMTLVEFTQRADICEYTVVNCSDIEVYKK